MKNLSLTSVAVLLIAMGLSTTLAGTQGQYPAYSGNKRMAVIMLAWADRACPATRQEMANKIWNNSDSLRKYYLDMSRNALDFVPPADAASDGTVPATTTAIYGPYELSIAAGFSQDVTVANAEDLYGGRYLDGTHSVAITLAAADGFDSANYEYVMYVMPKAATTGSMGGYAGVDATYSHMFVLRQNYINHEVGHNFGLSHSNTAIDVDGYDSQDCVMGNQANAHLDGVHTYNMGWYPDANFSVKTYGQYTVENLAEDTDNLKVIRFDRAAHGATTKSTYNLWIAYRVKGIGQDVGLYGTWDRKVNIHYCKAASKRPADYQYYYYFNNNVSKFSVGGNYTDPDNLCKVRYLREDNSSNASAVIQLIDPNGNQPPSVQAGQTPVIGVGLDVFTVTASDPDGDPLTYTIVTPPASGTLTNAGSAFTLVSSATGTYSFTVRVNDGQYDSYDQTVSITVEDPAVPSVSVAASDPDAAEEGEATGAWTISRSGSTAASLDVVFSLSGTAIGSDYSIDQTSPVTIPAGQRSAIITLTPVDDTIFGEREETVILTIAPDSAYTVNTAASAATVTITDNDNHAPVVIAGVDRYVSLVDDGAWTPGRITTVGWYDAGDAATVLQSGGAVAQWKDKSGNNRHVSQSLATQRPTVSANTVSFDGVDDHLWNSVPFMYSQGSIDVYMVMAAASGTDRRFLSEGSSTNNNSLYCLAQTDDSTASVMSAFIREDGGTTLCGHPMLSSGGALNGTLKVYQWRDTGRSISGRVNGGSETSSGYTRSGTMTINRFSLGGIRRSTPSHFANADINEIVMTANLSDADRLLMEGYLAHKWGLTADLPADHPYKIALPNSSSVSVQLNDATVDDADSEALTTTWSVVSKPAGSTVAFDDVNLVNATVTVNMAGTYVLRLTADDGIETVYDDVVITVGSGGGPIIDVNLPAGISLYGYTGADPIDAQTAFQTLIDNSQLSLVRWVNPVGGTIKELYYTTFPTAGWINEIGDLTLGQGYVVKTTAACTLSISGNKSATSVSYDLPAGYSIMGFNKETPLDARTAFQPLIDAGKLDLLRWVDPADGQIKELYYTTFPTPGWVNEIGDLTEGQGYIIKLNAPHSGFMLP